MTTDKKPRLRLTGQDGNAFCLLALAQRTAKKAGWPPKRWRAISEDAMSGDYHHLLSVLMEHFDVI